MLFIMFRVQVCLFLCISYGNLDRGPFVERLKFTAAVRDCEFSVGGKLDCLIVSACVAVVCVNAGISVVVVYISVRMQ
jgi:hypothetical protein